MGDVVEGVKQLYEFGKRGLTVEAQQKYLDLQEDIINIKSENLDLKTRVQELEKKLAVKEDLHFDGGVYWLGEENKDGPYCQKCYDGQDRLVRLQDRGRQWRCYNCSCVYWKPGQEPSPSSPRPPRHSGRNWMTQ